MDLDQLARMLLPLPPAQRAVLLNQAMSGFDAAIGLRFVSVSLRGWWPRW